MPQLRETLHQAILPAALAGNTEFCTNCWRNLGDLQPQFGALPQFQSDPAVRPQPPPQFSPWILLLEDASYPPCDPRATRPDACLVARCVGEAAPSSILVHLHSTSHHTADWNSDIRVRHIYSPFAMGSGRPERIVIGCWRFVCDCSHGDRRVMDHYFGHWDLHLVCEFHPHLGQFFGRTWTLMGKVIILLGVFCHIRGIFTKSTDWPRIEETKVAPSKLEKWRHKLYTSYEKQSLIWNWKKAWPSPSCSI